MAEKTVTPVDKTVPVRHDDGLKVSNKLFPKVSCLVKPGSDVSIQLVVDGEVIDALDFAELGPLVNQNWYVEARARLVRSTMDEASEAVKAVKDG